MMEFRFRDRGGRKSLIWECQEDIVQRRRGHCVIEFYAFPWTRETIVLLSASMRLTLE